MKAYKTKKLTCVLVAALMMSSFSGCGAKDDSEPPVEYNSETTIDSATTEAFGTEEEIKGNVDEPSQEIDEGALIPEDTTEANSEQPTVDNGSYKYTIYDGIEVSLPFDIDDYIITASHGEPGLKVYYMATDLGWTSIEDSDTYFYYDCGDYYIYFKHDECYDEECNFPGAWENSDIEQIKSFSFWFSPPNERGEYYYSTLPSEDVLHSSIEVYFDKHYDKLEYVYLGTNTTALSRDDAILIAYVLSFAKNHPGENPFYYLDLSNSDVGGGPTGKVFQYTMP